MLLLATDWSTISSLATGAGTLVLAVATFAAVRSSNRSALIAEVALREQRRPILVPSRLHDPEQKLNFADGHWVKASGAFAVARFADDNVYLAISLRNVGNGIGVCQGWAAKAGQTLTSQMPTHIPVEEFRTQSRDLYIPGGDIGMWQGALRNPEDPLRIALASSIVNAEPITIELLYSDLTGLQRAITRFGLLPAPTEEHPDRRYSAMSRLWFLDTSGPRPDNEELVKAIALVQAETGTLSSLSSAPTPEIDGDDNY